MSYPDIRRGDRLIFIDCTNKIHHGYAKSINKKAQLQLRKANLPDFGPDIAFVPDEHPQETWYIYAHNFQHEGTRP